MARKKKWVGGYVDVSGNYYVKRRVGGVQTHFSTRCKTLPGALAALAEWESNPATYVPGKSVTPPVSAGWADSVERYLDYSENVKGNCAKHVRSQAGCFDAFDKYFALHGISTLTAITPAVMDAYVSWRRQGGVTGRVVGPHSIGLDVAAMKALMTWASREPDQGGFLSADPLGKYRCPKRPSGSSKVKTFGMDWWQAVRAHLEEKFQLAGDVLLGSSMRWSSLSRLQCDDVDVEAGLIRLRGNAIKGKDGVTVYVSTDVAKAAARLSLMSLPPDSNAINYALRIACRAAGVPVMTAHAFRHTSASMAIADGVEGPALQRRLAHARFSTTETYIHLLGGSKEPYRGRI